MTSMKQRRLLHSPHLTCQRTSRSAQDKLRLAVAVDSHADVSKHGAQRVDMRRTGVGVMWSPELASQVPLLPHDLKGNSEHFGCGCNMMQPFSDACRFDVFQICISVKYHESTCSMLEPFESTRKMLIQTSGTVSESSPTRVTPNCWVMSRITNSCLISGRSTLEILNPWRWWKRCESQKTCQKYPKVMEFWWEKADPNFGDMILRSETLPRHLVIIFPDNSKTFDWLWAHDTANSSKDLS